jgi:hypothetical protein
MFGLRGKQAYLYFRVWAGIYGGILITLIAYGKI